MDIAKKVKNSFLKWLVNNKHVLKFISNKYVLIFVNSSLMKFIYNKYDFLKFCIIVICFLIVAALIWLSDYYSLTGYGFEMYKSAYKVVIWSRVYRPMVVNHLLNYTWFHFAFAVAFFTTKHSVKLIYNINEYMEDILSQYPAVRLRCFMYYAIVFCMFMIFYNIHYGVWRGFILYNHLLHYKIFFSLYVFSLIIWTFRSNTFSVNQIFFLDICFIVGAWEIVHGFMPHVCDRSFYFLIATQKQYYYMYLIIITYTYTGLLLFIYFIRDKGMNCYNKNAHFYLIYIFHLFMVIAISVTIAYCMWDFVHSIDIENPPKGAKWLFHEYEKGYMILITVAPRMTAVVMFVIATITHERISILSTKDFEKEKVVLENQRKEIADKIFNKFIKKENDEQKNAKRKEVINKIFNNILK